jgi:prepilin-type N-terminal cleavage/methylation domain-containing protein
MNKKGFTLTELLAVIAIIAIITLIAVPSVIAIYRNMNVRMYENKKDMIISAAELYGSNNPDIFNGKTEVVIYVRELIASNYLTVDAAYNTSGCDEEIGCLIDPRTKESMNDEYVVLRKEAVGYSATFGGSESLAVTGTLVEQVCKKFNNGSFIGKYGSGNNDYCGCKFTSGEVTGIFRATKNDDGTLTVGSSAVSACIISGDEKNNYLKYDGVYWRVLGVYNIYDNGNRLVVKIITNDIVDSN